MTAMLASVNSLAEAEVVFRAGVDVLDLKDPQRGVLGAVPPDVAGAAARCYGGRCLVSATIGDVPPEPEPVARGIRAMAATGVDIVKVGIFGPDASPALLAALAAGPVTRIVAVLFAEFGLQPALLAALGRCGIRGVMLDTAEKGTGGLRRKLTESELREFVRRRARNASRWAWPVRCPLAIFRRYWRSSRIISVSAARSAAPASAPPPSIL
jgi:uncharacterized protein (UPF0264 family)